MLCLRVYCARTFLNMGWKVSIRNEVPRPRHVVEIREAVFTQMLCVPGRATQVHTLANNPEVSVFLWRSIKQVRKNCIRVAGNFSISIRLVDNLSVIDGQAHKYLTV